MAQDEYIRTALRVPPELHRQLHDAATQADRSFNGEILARLAESFEEDSEVTVLRTALRSQTKILKATASMAHTLARALNTFASDKFEVPEKLLRALDAMRSDDDPLELMADLNRALDAKMPPEMPASIDAAIESLDAANGGAHRPRRRTELKD